jgi:hypothetical protein
MAPRFTLKAGDTRPSIPSTLVYADGTPADLTDATVTFIMRAEGDPDALPTVEGAAEKLAPLEDGRVAYNWVAGDTDPPGAYLAEWRWVLGDEVATFPNDGPIFVHIRPSAALA